jgi:hypothetical protein
LALRRRARYGGDDCRRENQNQRYAFGSRAQERERQQRQRGSQGNPGKPGKSDKQAANNS